VSSIDPNPLSVPEDPGGASSADWLHAPLATSERREAWLELGVVVVIGVLPHLVNSLIAFAPTARGRDHSSWASYAGQSAWLLQMLVGLLWIMRRSGWPWARFGLSRPLPTVDLLLGVLTTGWFWVCGWGAMVASLSLSAIVPGFHELCSLLPSAVPASHFAAPMTPAASALFVLYVLVATAGEELVLRAYLLPRLTGLLGSTWKAVLISAVLAASYHIYQGSDAAIQVAIGQVPVSLLYLKVRRIWPFFMGHAVYDIVLMYTYYT
jgi:hypothetical protein